MTGPQDHIGVDELADAQAGVLPPDRAQAVEQHLHECADCRTQAEGLTAVGSMLSAAPAEAMPPDVAARIADALAAERGGARTVVPLQSRRRALRGVNLAGFAAAAAVVALIAAVAVSHFSGGGKSSGVTAENQPALGAPSSLTAGQALALVTTEHATGTNYTAKSVEPLLLQQLGGNTAEPGAFPENSPMRQPTGSSAKATSAPSRSMSGSPERPVAPSATGLAIPKPLRGLSNSAQLFSCVKVLNNNSFTVPLAVDFATYDGKPAAVVVLPPNSSLGIDHPNAYVVPPNCGTAAFSSEYLVQAVPTASATVSAAPASPPSSASK